MTNDPADVPVENRETPPGLGERLARWGMAVILAFFVGIFLRIVVESFASKQVAYVLAQGLSMAVFFNVGYGVRSVRVILVTTAMGVLLSAVFEWLWR